jgi:5'-3' exonuclease
LIFYRHLEDAYGYLPDEKLCMDCLVGVSKENVPGIRMFGPKKFKALWEMFDGDCNAIVESLGETYDGSDKLPERFSTVREMYEFNYMLFKPWSFEEDFTEEELEYIKAQVSKEIHPSQQKIMEESFELFNNLYVPNYAEIQFYKIGD